MERHENEAQSLTDSKNEENVTVNSKVLFPDVERTEGFLRCNVTCRKYTC